MSNPIQQLVAVNLGAFATLAIVFCALFVFEGADAPAMSALFAASLIFWFLINVALAPSHELAQSILAHFIGALAAFVFIGWHLATAAPLPTALVEAFAHPLAGAFDWRRPAISIAPQATLEGVAAMLGPMAAFALGVLTTPDRSRRDWAGRWLVVFTILLSVFALYDHVTLATSQGARLDARMVSPNAAAAVFGALAIFCAALILRAGGGKLGALVALPAGWGWSAGFIAAPLSTAALILALTCATLTASRGGVLAFGAGFFFFAGLVAIRSFRQRVTSIWIALVLGAIATAIWVFAQGGGALVDRLSDGSGAAASRWDLLLPHWQAFLDRPLLGNGLNTYHEINSLAATPENLQELGRAGAAHNIYVQALEETGILGTCIMALMLAPPLLRAFANAVAGVAGTEWSAAMCGVALLFLLHGIVDFELQIPAVAALFAFCLGAFVHVEGARGASRRIG
jgi:O-antigen ligase